MKLILIFCLTQYIQNIIFSICNWCKNMNGIIYILRFTLQHTSIWTNFICGAQQWLVTIWSNHTASSLSKQSSRSTISWGCTKDCSEGKCMPGAWHSPDTKHAWGQRLPSVLWLLLVILTLSHTVQMPHDSPVCLFPVYLDGLSGGPGLEKQGLYFPWARRRRCHASWCPTSWHRCDSGQWFRIDFRIEQVRQVRHCLLQSWVKRGVWD